MDTKPIQINRRSKNITEGKSRAPNRSMYYAMGYQDDDFKKPMVGVANLHSNITPCNAHLDRLARKAIEGIRAGGVPQIFGAPPLRRHHDGPPGHALLPRQPRSHRRLHRSASAA